MAMGERAGAGILYNRLLWDAAGGDCSLSCAPGTSMQLKHMKINWTTISHNKNQVKQNAPTCKPCGFPVKSFWCLDHTSVTKGGETCIAEPTTGLPKSQCWILLVTCRAPTSVLFFEESCLSVAPWNMYIYIYIYVCWFAERCEGQQYRCVRCFVSQRVNIKSMF